MQSLCDLMWCLRCDKDVVDCTCPDIEERLRAISHGPALKLAAAQNKLARDEKKRKEADPNYKPEEN